MKKIKILSLVGTALVGLTQPVWAGPHGGAGGFVGGGHFGGGGHVGGASRPAPAFSGGSLRAAPVFRGSGAYFTGRSVSGPGHAPRFYYRSSNRMPDVTPHGFTAPTSRSINPNTGRVTVANSQPNRVSSVAGRSRVSDPRTSTAANAHSFIRNHAFARHDANWHHDWDRRHAHFHNGHVFVFLDGFWWGLDPGLYPYDYYAYGDYPDGYDYGYPNGYYGDYGYYDPGYVASDQYANNATVGAVQSQLAKLGYYRGTIDGILGDQTQDSIARYQEDHDLSVTGTLTAATLRSLGLAGAAS
jgi:hypothetical protein